MTLYHKVDDMPEEIRKSQAARLENIWYEGTRGLLRSAEFLESVVTDSGNFALSRTVGWDDEFFTTAYVNLPFRVQVRLESIINDLMIISTALANAPMDLGYTPNNNNNNNNNEGENQ